VDERRLKALEDGLNQRGTSLDLRRAIRSSKIGIVDDRLEDLQTFVESLEHEGFTHLVKLQEVTSINDLIELNLDLLILDLVVVATNVSEADGVGVLTAIKKAYPALPVLVVSGNTVTPSLASDIANADLIRSKPILAAELADDVEQLLRAEKDDLWGALAVLQELRRLDQDIRAELPWLTRLRLWFVGVRLARSLEKGKDNSVRHIVKIASLLQALGTLAARVTRISTSLTSG